LFTFIILRMIHQIVSPLGSFSFKEKREDSEDETSEEWKAENSST